jgi:hypothetical protein
MYDITSRKSFEAVHKWVETVRRSNYTRNEWRRCQTTLETSGEDLNYSRNEWRRCKTTLETSGEDLWFREKSDDHSLVMILVGNKNDLVASVDGIFSTRFEWNFTSFPLVSSVVSHLPHSFRVWFYNLKVPRRSPLEELWLKKRENSLQTNYVKLHSKRVGKM